MSAIFQFYRMYQSQVEHYHCTPVPESRLMVWEARWFGCQLSYPGRAWRPGMSSIERLHQLVIAHDIELTPQPHCCGTEELEVSNHTMPSNGLVREAARQRGILIFGEAGADAPPYRINSKQPLWLFTSQQQMIMEIKFLMRMVLSKLSSILSLTDYDQWLMNNASSVTEYHSPLSPGTKRCRLC